jgi:hypothetical protein
VRSNVRVSLVVAVCLLLVGAAEQQQAVTVDRQPPRVRTRTFDPKGPSKDVPKLEGSEAAVTESAFGISAEFTVLVLEEEGRRSRVRVTGVHLTTKLEITMWLPAGAGGRLVEHEDGHRRISELFYTGAGDVARGLAQRYVGRAFTGEADTPEAARKAALKKAISDLNGEYMRVTQAPAARVNEIFDELTDHGRNAVAVEEAIERSLERYRAEDRASSSTAQTVITVHE